MTKSVSLDLLQKVSFGVQVFDRRGGLMADFPVAFSSMDASIADVVSDGKGHTVVIARAVGTATIVGHVADGIDEYLVVTVTELLPASADSEVGVPEDA